MKLSIILPVYSETQSLLDTVQQIHNFVPPASLYEIIMIISPRSTAESFTVCEQLLKQYSFIHCYIQQNNPGIGWAIREALEKVRGTHVLFMACDGETNPKFIPFMIKKVVETGCDIVIANRWSGDGGFERYGIMKYIFNFFFQNILKTLFISTINDYTYAYRLYRIEALQGYSWEETGFPFLLESLLKPIKNDYKVEQIPAHWVPRAEGESKNNFFKMLMYAWIAFKVYLRK